MNKAFIFKIFYLFDVKRKGVIDFDDFVRSINVFHPNAPLEDKIDFSFRLYDLDSTGIVECQKVKQMLIALLCESEMKLADEDKRGEAKSSPASLNCTAVKTCRCNALHLHSESFLSVAGLLNLLPQGTIGAISACLDKDNARFARHLLILLRGSNLLQLYRFLMKILDFMRLPRKSTTVWLRHLGDPLAPPYSSPSWPQPWYPGIFLRCRCCDQYSNFGD
ncbi:uncharacterized protein LOC107605109 isoform X2 [Arachis ipaensis]|uniref:uncharacterized protein LOC107605109 isoform X2 n=1 Tax=Arachis ipaensis TaxID=130454 RepID=UPI0007AEFF96|nr:uncharacterized protein LOC107605109 isoform X2 [Arachis ipaensis]XP_025659712.1 uncharacterized protein LOC112755679 isoform X2 [Arachis hypogaea]